MSGGLDDPELAGLDLADEKPHLVLLEETPVSDEDLAPSFRSMSNSHGFQFLFRHEHIRRCFNAHRNQRASNADHVAFLERVLRHFEGVSFLRGLARRALAGRADRERALHQSNGYDNRDSDCGFRVVLYNKRE
jgi:hypothetical protein